MALQQSVGTLAAVAAGEPATHDQAGFEALTFTNVGSINAIPDLVGVYDIASADLLDQGEEVKFADILRAGEGDLVLWYDEDDAGQAIIEAQVGQKVSWRFTLRSGTVYYRTGIIRSYGPTGVAVGNVTQSTTSVAFEKIHVKV